VPRVIDRLSNPRDRGLSIRKPHVFFQLGVWWCQALVDENGLIEREATGSTAENAYRGFMWLYGKKLFRFP